MILRKATIEDWELLLKWRNDIETRKYFHDTEIVEIENHKKWLTSVLQDENKQLFLAVENGVPVGTVRAEYEKANNEYKLSWTISPDFRGKGMGKKMVKMLADQLQSRIRAEIKYGNISSIKIAEYIGMTCKKKENTFLYYSNH